MLRIFTSKENIDKQQFMFEEIRRKNEEASGLVPSQVYVLVPDQFTLETERIAFTYMKTDAFISPIVMSFSRLADKVFSEIGLENSSFIDKYGKYMLISGILYEGRENYELLKNMESSSAYIEKISNVIMSLKSHMVTPDDLEEYIGKLSCESLLVRKLRDIHKVYREYEKSISGSLPDAMDYLGKFKDRMAESELISGGEFWISGFDYFSPLHIEIIRKLSECAKGVNLLLTAEAGNSFFALTNTLAETVSDGLRDAVRSAITGREYAFDRPPEIAHIENALFSFPQRLYDGEDSGALRIVAASDYYTEAEAAAAVASRLIREEGLRHKDIVVLTNDLDVRGEIIKRIFENYGLPVFMDRRRNVDHNPVLEYILALPELLVSGLSRTDVVRWVKTGLVGIDAGTAEELENYAIKYNLRGSAWGKPLKRGAKDYEGDEETFASICAAAEVISHQASKLKELIGGRKNIRERVCGLETFLTETADLPSHIEAYADELAATGHQEYESEMRAIWDVVCGILEQIRSTMNHIVSIDEFSTILNVGFQSIKIGVLPGALDSIVLGTMQRTRTNDVKAVFMLGANEGELPKFSGSDGLITDAEMEQLQIEGINIGRSDETLLMEEELAIYKNLSKPTRLLYISHSLSSEDGSSLRPAFIVNRLSKMFPKTPVEVIRRKEASAELFVWTPKSALPHLTEAVREAVAKGGELSPMWQAVLAWFAANDRNALLPIYSGINFAGRAGKIEKQLLHKILPTDGDSILTSPSAIEKYKRCSFAYFMDRGLRLRERRPYEIDARSMGDLYHKVLEYFGREMDADGKPANSEASAWNTISKEAVHSLVSDIAKRISAVYEDGLYLQSKENMYRADRIETVSKEMAWLLTENIRGSGTEKIYYEALFDEHGELPIIDIETDNGKIKIRGRIDRLDILSGDYVKILDFKSGNQAFSQQEVEAGWQLQLMIYLKAAAKKYKPAGVAYFNIKEEKIDLSKFAKEPSTEEIEAKLSQKYKGSGIALSTVAGEAKGSGTLEPEALIELSNKVDEILAEVASGLTGGEIEARPIAVYNGKGTKTREGCDYCEYLSICNRM